MKQLVQLAILIFAFSFSSNAQNKKKQDQKAIKDMCGCYEVTFNFAETFEYSEDSTYVPSKTKHDKGLEWVQLVEDESDKISMQHLLIVGSKEQPYIVKHWRQDWEFENTDLYEFDHNNKWTFISLPKKEVKGQWTQKVFQVDDTKRSDYNVTLRTNRHEIVENGWIHDQDNDKIIREDAKEDVVLAQEKGHNTYVKVEDVKCVSAQDYWKKNEVKWALVRAKWDEVFARNKDLVLEEKVDNKVLYKYLFDKEKYQTAEEINLISIFRLNVF